jgi:beta-glucosidase
MPFRRPGNEYASTLHSCVTEGNVTGTRIAEALTRVLTPHFNLGWFDTIGAIQSNLPDPVPYNQVTIDGNVSNADHRALSRQAARETMVLLKNERGTLPLSLGNGSNIALIGPAGKN